MGSLLLFSPVKLANSDSACFNSCSLAGDFASEMVRAWRRCATARVTMIGHGEPLARMIPIRRRQAIPKHEVLAIFATSPVIDADELRSDLDAAVSQQLGDL